MEQAPENNLNFKDQNQSRTWIIFFLCLLLGSLSCLFAIAVIDIPKKFMIAVAAAVLFASGLLSIRNSRYVFNILLALFAFSIAVNLDINFFIRPNEAGAAGITFSLPILIALTLIILIYAINFPQFPKMHFHPALLIPTLLYMAAGIVSIINAAHPILVFFELFRLLLLLIICFLIMNLQDSRQIMIIIRFLCLGILLQGCLAIIQYKTGRQLGLGIFGEEELLAQYIGHKAARATGTIGHPNILAYYFEILLPLIFALLLTDRKKNNKLFYLLTMSIGFLGILTTLSRGGWLSIGITLPLIFIILFYQKLFRIKTAMGILGLSILMAGPLYFAYPTIERRLTHTDYGSSSLRIPLNKAALSIIEQFPVIGVGMNNFAEIFRQYDSTGYANALRGSKNVVHNLYLLIWAEVGTVGFFFFLTIFIMIFFLVFKSFLHVSTRDKGILIGCGGGLFAHLIHGFFDPGFKASLPISILVYTLIGLIGAILIPNTTLTKPEIT